MSGGDGDVQCLFDGFETQKEERKATVRYMRFPSESDDEPSPTKDVAPPGQPPGPGGDGKPAFQVDELSTEIFAAVPELKRLLDRLHPKPATIEAKLGTLLNRFQQLETENAKLIAEAISAGSYRARDRDGGFAHQKSLSNNGLHIAIAIDSIHPISADQVEAELSRVALALGSGSVENEIFALDNLPGNSSLLDESMESLNGGDAIQPPRPTCWNCSQPGHSLADCKEPRNQAEISKNRAQMTRSSSHVDARYHGENAKKWAAFKPGAIGESLREALGLKEDELPPWIYAMRKLGYPPGHLREARERKPPLEFEDGSSKDGAKGPRQLKLDDIHAYPGFNVKTPRHVKDAADSKRSRGHVRPQSPSQRREKLLRRTNDDLLREHAQDAPMEPAAPTLPPPPPAPSSPEVEEVGGNGDAAAIPLQTEAEAALNGTSAAILPGTPLGFKSPAQSRVGLDSFAVGIVPFSAEEASPDDPTAKRGNFAAIKNSIAQLRASQPNLDEEEGEVD